MYETGKKYQIIYADPPWAYKDKANAGKRGASHKYDVMTIDDIKSLQIEKISSDDCILFMWVTFPLLQEGLDTMRAWGFTYKTVAFNWVKLSKGGQKLHWGMGNYTRANSEICLMGIRGKPKRISASVHSVVETWDEEIVYDKIRSHSQKPDLVRDKIVELMGDIPRIELFARQSAEGWDVIGNGIDGQDIREVLK